MYSLWQKICNALLFSKNSIAQDVLPTPKKLEPYFTDLLRCVSTSYSSRRGAGKLRHLGSGGAFRWYFVVVCYLFFFLFICSPHPVLHHFTSNVDDYRNTNPPFHSPTPLNRLKGRNLFHSHLGANAEKHSHTISRTLLRHCTTFAGTSDAGIPKHPEPGEVGGSGRP